MSKPSGESLKEGDTKIRKRKLNTNADVEVYNVVLVHVRHSLTDLTQPTDAVQLTVVPHLHDPRQQINTRDPEHAAPSVQSRLAAQTPK